MLPPGASASAPPLPLLSPPPPSPRLGPSPEASPLLRPAAPPPARSNRSTGSERGTIAVPVNGRGVRRPSSPRSGEQHRRSAPSGSSFEPMSRSKTARMSVTCRKSASEHEKRSRGSSASHQLHVSSAPSPPKPADGPRTEPPITARHALASPVTAVPVARTPFLTEEVGTGPPSRPGGLVKKAMYGSLRPLRSAGMMPCREREPSRAHVVAVASCCARLEPAAPCSRAEAATSKVAKTGLWSEVETPGTAARLVCVTAEEPRPGMDRQRMRSQYEGMRCCL
mmetsp:Transcript_22539/g.64065  ORF Transcript_22539/g.64065 Transcript_22539/m.64065 type:complete len:282 (+) Transcript_22539:997-1842(+)